MWDLLLLGLIWGKGKGKWRIFVRLTGWRGEDWEQWEDSIVFDNFVKLGKLGPSLPSWPSLTDFNRVWLNLTEFTDFRVFYPISHDIPELTRKIVRFYESTHEFDNHDYTINLILYQQCQLVINLIS